MVTVRKSEIQGNRSYKTKYIVAENGNFSTVKLNKSRQIAVILEESVPIPVFYHAHTQKYPRKRGLVVNKDFPHGQNHHVVETTK